MNKKSFAYSHDSLILFTSHMYDSVVLINYVFPIFVQQLVLYSLFYSRSAQTLVIDEVWMLSKAIFEKVEFVCRLVRDNNSVFGGLQVKQFLNAC